VSSILFVTWDGGGNVPPAMGIATELRSRGHDVRFMGHPALADRFAAAGVAFQAFDSARPFRSTDSNSPVALGATFGDRAMGRDVVAELRRRPADAVVVDCLLFGVMAALAADGRDYAVLEHFYDEYLMRRWLRGPMGLAMALQRIPARRLLDRARLRVVATSPELDPGSARCGHNVEYTWPVVTGVSARPSEPTVLVSLSTFNYPGQATALQRILDAAGEVDARVVVTTGPSIQAEPLRPPPNAELHAWLPHDELLPSLSLVVGHGGHATTMAALAHDLPLLILPMSPFLDQPLVGRSVQQSGAGRMLSKKAGAQQIRAAMVDLLAPGPHRVAAARLGAAIRGGRGAATAADRVESLVPDGARHP
jgi:UDP:flavonoid glycosyltransferase YjiC (YdhE family)